MAEESVDRINRKQMLSALADGELDADQVRSACALWREDEEVRRQWHAYQLIGDVLRSDDLAGAPLRDEVFLASLRKRLQQEPTVLAPSPIPGSTPSEVASRRPRRAWAAPVAVAAGFVAVAGVLVVTRLSGPVADPGAGASLAAQSSALPAGVALASDRGDAGASASVVDADTATPGQDMRIVRDPRLDRYLAAHKQYAGQSAAAVPAVSLRHATLVPER